MGSAFDDNSPQVVDIKALLIKKDTRKFPGESYPLSFQDIADRFGISRKTVEKTARKWKKVLQEKGIIKGDIS